MAERKVTCPNCLDSKHCFEEDINQIEISSPICVLIVVSQVILHILKIQKHLITY